MMNATQAKLATSAASGGSSSRHLTRNISRVARNRRESAGSQQSRMRPRDNLSILMNYKLQIDFMDSEKVTNSLTEGHSNEKLAKNSDSNPVSELIQRFEETIRKIEESQWKVAISQAAKTYHLKNYNIEKLNPPKVVALYRIVALKFYNNEKNKATWHENELRIYVWLLLTYSHLIKLSPQSFNKTHWEFLTGFFMGKSVSLCQFQFRNLKKVHQKSQIWLHEEDELLQNILRSCQDRNKWNQIAKQMYFRSEQRFFRTAKQCRERWNNYLDPGKNKGNWTVLEDQNLLRYVLENGKKWSLISKIMDNTRTEHMVKNRYKSLIAKHTKKLRKRQIQENQLLRLIVGQLENTLHKPEEEPKAVCPPVVHQEREQKKKNQTFVLSPPQSAFSRISFRSGEMKMDYDWQKQTQTHFIQQTQTPSAGGFIISPIPLNFTPGFSPFGEFGHGIIYTTHKTPRPESNGLIPPNYFSFENLPQSK